MFIPVSVPDRFRIIAHRGASAYAPENTRVAFQRAIDMGSREIETDARLSADGQVVLCHDDTLERYGHGPAAVENLNSADLLTLDMGSWFSPFLYRGEPVLTLHGLFNTFQTSLIYHIELKGNTPGLPEKVNALVQRYGYEDRVIITSFSCDRLARMRRVCPTMRLAWLIQDIDDAALARASELSFFQLCPRADRLDERMIQKAHEAGFDVRAWGLGGSSLEVVRLIHRVIQTGCDGATINWPDWMSFGQAV